MLQVTIYIYVKKDNITGDVRQGVKQNFTLQNIQLHYRVYAKHATLSKLKFCSLSNLPDYLIDFEQWISAARINVHPVRSEL